MENYKARIEEAQKNLKKAETEKTRKETEKEQAEKQLQEIIEEMEKEGVSPEIIVEEINRLEKEVDEGLTKVETMIPEV